MKRFERITRDYEDCKVEYEFLYVWREPYQCIDARYLHIDTVRSTALSGLRAFIYRVMAMNPNMSKDDLANGVNDVLQNALLKGKRSSISENDVYEMCSTLANTEIPSNVRDWLYSKKRTEWKKDVRALIQLTDDEKAEYEGITDKKEREKYLSKMNRDKKRNEAMRCIRDLGKSETIDRITCGLQVFLDTPELGSLSIQELSAFLKISVNTLKKYSNEVMEMFGYIQEEGRFIEDKRVAESERNQELLVDACYDINEAKELITKMKLHRKTSISRPTIDRNYNDERIRLGVLVEELNSKI